MSLLTSIARIALAEVGVEEKPRGSNRGPRVDEYQAATWLERHQWGAWCAAFICWVLREAMIADGRKFTFKRPKTAGARDFRRWSLEQDASTRTKDKPGADIQPWDILIFNFPHIAFAVTKPDKYGFVETVEGNTNEEGGPEGYMVAHRTGKKARHISTIATRIRITV